MSGHNSQGLEKLITSWPQWLVGLLAGSWCLRFLIAWLLPPGFDEAYYFLYTQHWGWSYFDHPVMVALTTAIGPWLTGYISPFTLRLGALFLYGVSTGLLYLIGRRLFNATVGMWGVAIASLCPLFIFSFGLLAAPDNALILWWSAVMYVAVNEFFPDHQRPYRPTAKIALMGILLGFVCLSKYHGFILGLSLVGFCLTSQQHRRALISLWTAVALLLFVLTLAPLLYWNANHDWLSFGFHLSTRFDGNTTPTTFNGFTMVGVWLVGIAYMFPSIGFPLWWTSLRGVFQVRDQRKRFLLWMGLPISLGFTCLGGVTHIYPAWPAPGLWSLGLLLATEIANWPMLAVRRWLTSSATIMAILLNAALGHISLGLLQQPGGLIELMLPESDPTTTLIDVVQLRRQLQSEGLEREITDADFLVTNEFWLSGYVDMAISPMTSAPVMAFTQDPRGHTVWFNPMDWLGKSALFLSIADYEQNDIRATYAPYFEKFEPLATITTQRAGATTETFYLYDVGRLTRSYRYPY
ncbi:MAG: glycosyltransferase family 39 protein [Cyanobacteria bacterium P01_D01_bin.156]